MLKKINIRSTLLYGLAGAVAFCIPVFFYIQSANYKDSWLLYLGSFLFMGVAAIHIMQDSKERRNNESTVSLVFSSHVTTIVGILIACIICFLMLAIFVPGYLGHGTTDKVLTQEPANTIKDRTNGLSFKIFLTATVINFAAGSFCGIVLPFTLKRNQTEDSKEPVPLHQAGAK
jgi:multisubunit Na+/H+ antiporter MnhC subunit